MPMSTTTGCRTQNVLIKTTFTFVTSNEFYLNDFCFHIDHGVHTHTCPHSGSARIRHNSKYWLCFLCLSLVYASHAYDVWFCARINRQVNRNVMRPVLNRESSQLIQRTINGIVISVEWRVCRMLRMGNMRSTLQK